MCPVLLQTQSHIIRAEGLYTVYWWASGTFELLYNWVTNEKEYLEGCWDVDTISYIDLLLSTAHSIVILMKST